MEYAETVRYTVEHPLILELSTVKRKANLIYVYLSHHDVLSHHHRSSEPVELY